MWHWIFKCNTDWFDPDGRLGSEVTVGEGVSPAAALAKVRETIEATRTTTTFDGYRVRGVCTNRAGPYNAARPMHSPFGRQISVNVGYLDTRIAYAAAGVYDERPRSTTLATAA